MVLHYQSESFLACVRRALSCGEAVLELYTFGQGDEAGERTPEAPGGVQGVG